MAAKAKPKSSRFKSALYLSWAGLTALWIALAALFPLSGDDWQWGFSTGLATFNGRYLGNFFTRVLVQALWLKPLVVGLTIAFIIIAVTLLSGMKTVLSGTFFITLMPAVLFSQVFQWTSGFGNYTLPVALLLVNALLYRYKDGFPPFARVCAYIVAPVIACAAQLFAEHTTIFAATFSLVILVYEWVRKKHLDIFLILSVLGYIAGAAIMFSNPAYSSSGASGAHKMPGLSDLIINMTVNYKNQFVPHLFLNLVWVNVALSLCLVCVIAASGKARKPLGGTLSVCSLLYGAYSVARVFHAPILSHDYVRFAECLMVPAFCAVCLITVVLYIPSAEIKRNLLLAALAAVLLNAPLLTVNPIGPRCFFATYVVYVYIIGVLFRYLQSTSRPAAQLGILKQAAIAMLVCTFGIYFFIYGRTAKTYADRSQALGQALSESGETVIVEPVPYPNYVWTGNPTTDYVQLIYKRYYGIPQEYTLEIR